MERKSSNPADWFFVPYPKKYWESRGRPMVFINPKADNGEWDQSTYPDLQTTVFSPLASRFSQADEPVECHIEISGGTEAELHAELLALGMEQRRTKDFF